MEIRTRTDLYKLLPEHPSVAEIGVAEGLYSLDIMKWSPSHLYLIDLWETHAEFPGDAGSDQKWHNANYNNVFKNLGHRPEVKILRGPSVGMSQRCPDDFFDLVYIDACHSYECVLNDLKAWYPKIKKGGIMAFHDYEMDQDYGVKQSVQEFCKLYNIDIHLIPENKKEDSGAWFYK